MLLGARKVHCDFTADGQLTMPFICEVDASIGAITSHIVKFDLGHRLDGSLKEHTRNDFKTFTFQRAGWCGQFR